MKCPNCGYTNRGDANFCGKCGCQLEAPKGEMRISTWIAIAVCLVLAIAIGGYAIAQRSTPYRVQSAAAQNANTSEQLAELDEEEDRAACLALISEVMNGLIDGDTDQVLAAMPDEVLAYNASERGVTVEEYRAKTESEVSFIRAALSARGTIHFQWQIEDFEAYDEDELEELQDKMSEKYGIYPTKAYTVGVCVSYSIEAEDYSDESHESGLFIEVSGQWYSIDEE